MTGAPDNPLTTTTVTQLAGSRPEALTRAHVSRSALTTVGRPIVAGLQNIGPPQIVVLGFLTRAYGLHSSIVAALHADDPYSAFTLLRAYAENAAGLIWAADHPDSLDRFLPDNDHSPKIKIGVMTAHAQKRMPGMMPIYKQLSEFAHPGHNSILAAWTADEDGIAQWSAKPKFHNENDFLIAAGWTVELAEINAHAIHQFAIGRELKPKPGPSPVRPHGTGAAGATQGSL